jgi:GH24 family phage-related lysozyme (muramidase)
MENKPSDKEAQQTIEAQNGIISSLVEKLKEENKGKEPVQLEMFQPDVKYKQSEGPSLPKFLQSKQFKDRTAKVEDNVEENTLKNTSGKTASEILGSIYKLMQENREEIVRERELQKDKRKSNLDESDKMHKELIDALEEGGEGKKKGMFAKLVDTIKKPIFGKKAPKPSEKGKTSKGGKKGKKKKNKFTISGALGAAAVLGTGRAMKPTTGGIKFKGTDSDSGPSVPMTGGLAKIASSVIAKEEGLPRGGKAYWDPPGQSQKVSVGYGHQIKDNEYKQGFIQAGDEQVPLKGNRGIDTVLTPDQAQKLLQNDLPKYVDAAQKPLGSSWQKLEDPQKAALVSYAYNTGSTASLVKAGIKSPIESGDTKGAAEVIRDKGIKTAGGKFVPVLAKRRDKEAMIFASADVKGSEATPEASAPKNAQVASVSQQNKDLKDNMSGQKQQVAMINTTVNQSVNNQSAPQQQKPSSEGDKSPYVRKSYA